MSLFGLVRLNPRHPLLHLIHVEQASQSRGSYAKPTTFYARLVPTAFTMPTFTSNPLTLSASGAYRLDRPIATLMTFCSIALYGLILFYGLTKEELVGRRPLAKFLSIKLIVMFTFYQAFVVHLVYLRDNQPCLVILAGEV